MGPLTGKQQQLVQTLEVIRIEHLIPRYCRMPGRPPKDRAAMARAFVAKAVYDLPTTRMLLDRLDTDVVLRRVCGWERRGEVPSESVFSRAFAEFAATQLPQRVHEALIRETHHDRLVGHLSRDSTAIEAREKPATKEKAPPPPKRKRGRPKKGEEQPKVLTRLERQPTMHLPVPLAPDGTLHKLERQNQLNFGVKKIFSVGDSEYHAEFNFYNALNNDTVLAVRSNLYGTSTYDQPSSIMLGRLMRMALRVKW